MVRFPNPRKTEEIHTGEITRITPEGKAVVYCPDLGHVKEGHPSGGTMGTYVRIEELVG
jgi:hypothetical protein